MHIQNGVELFIAHSHSHAVPGKAGIVHDDIDISELFQRGGDEAVAKIRRGDATATNHGLTAIGFDDAGNLIGNLGVKVINHQPGTFACKLKAHGAANTPPTAGNQSDLAAQPVAGLLLFHGKILAR